MKIISSRIALGIALCLPLLGNALPGASPTWADDQQASTTATTHATTKTQQGWRIPARILPPPADASEALRKAIAAMPAPDIDAVLKATPGNREQWLALIRQNDEQVKKGVERLQRKYGVSIEEGSIAGVRVFTVTPRKINDENRDRLFLHVHGGAYILNGGRAALSEPILYAAHLGIRVITIDYRMPPDHPFPAALEDASAVYAALLKQHAPEKILMGGTSAGAGLVLATVLEMKKKGTPLPGALFLGTPWADLTKTGDSFFINEGIDHTLVTYDGVLEGAARLYANGHDLRDARLSPIYGDLAGLPPVFLVTGTRDLFLSIVARLHRKLRKAGVAADLHVVEGFAHGDYIGLSDTPEAREIYDELHTFIMRTLK